MFLTSFTISCWPFLSFWATGLLYLLFKFNLQNSSSSVLSNFSYWGQLSNICSRKQMEFCTDSLSLFKSLWVLSSSGEWLIFFFDFFVLVGATSSLHTPSRYVIMPMNCNRRNVLFSSWQYGYLQQAVLLPSSNRLQATLRNVTKHTNNTTGSVIVFPDKSFFGQILPSNR